MFKVTYILIFIILFGCADPPPVVKPDYDFSNMKTVVIYPTPDHKGYSGSGTIVNKSIVYYLMKMGINIVERESTPAVIKEASLYQSGITTQNIDVKLTSSDVVLFCTLTEFKDHEVIIVPMVTKNKGSTVTTVKTVDEPVVTKDDDGNETIIYETTITETTTTDKGSISESESVKYVPARVGMNIQFLDAGNGEVLWSNTYWYSSISLTGAVNECVYGLLKPLKSLLQ